MKFKDCLIESVSGGFTEEDTQKFKDRIKMHGAHGLVDNVKLKDGKIHYHLDGMSGNHLKKVGDAVHNVFNGKTLHKYKGPAEAGKGIALSLSDPEEAPVGHKNFEIFATEKGHPKHNEWRSTLHHTDKNAL